MKLIKKMYENTTIAVDFDGTLCVSKFPKIIAPKLEVIKEVKKLKEQGAKLILWTCREGEDLTEAIKFCNEYGLHFDYINENTEENKAMWSNDTRKVSASYYIDDKAINPVMAAELETANQKIELLKSMLRSAVFLFR